MKSITYLLAGMLILGCKSNVPMASTETQPQTPGLPPGEVEVIIPCSGLNYFTTTEVFRANSMGESIDVNVAQRRAMSNARAELAASIESTVKEVTDSYTISREANNKEALGQRYESLSRTVVNQELRGIKVICIKYTQTESGRYKAYVAIELSAQHLVDAYYEKLAEIYEFTTDEDFENFKKTFEDKMMAIKR